MESERWAGLSVEEKAKGAVGCFLLNLISSSVSICLSVSQEAEAKRSEVKKEIADTLKAF